MAKKPRSAGPLPRAGKPALVTIEIRLDPETVKQMKIQAIATDATVSEVVAELWRSTPRQFWLRRAAGSGEIPDAASPEPVPVPRLADAS